MRKGSEDRKERNRGKSDAEDQPRSAPQPPRRPGPSPSRPSPAFHRGRYLPIVDEAKSRSSEKVRRVYLAARPTGSPRAQILPVQRAANAGPGVNVSVDDPGTASRLRGPAASEAEPEIAETLERSRPAVEVAERLAVDRARRLFGADHANVKPHSATQRMRRRTTRCSSRRHDHGARPVHGGRIAPSPPAEVSGRPYEVLSYHVSRDTSLIDMDEVERIALRRRPRLIFAGWSAIPRPRLRTLSRDRRRGRCVFARRLSHFAGLVAAGLHPNPVPFADVVTTTIYKTSGNSGRDDPVDRAARCQDRHRGPHRSRRRLAHEIAGKAVSLGRGFRPTESARSARSPGPGLWPAGLLAHGGRRRADGWHGCASGPVRPA